MFSISIIEKYKHREEKRGHHPQHRSNLGNQTYFSVRGYRCKRAQARLSLFFAFFTVDSEVFLTSLSLVSPLLPLVHIPSFASLPLPCHVCALPGRTLSLRSCSMCLVKSFALNSHNRLDTVRRNVETHIPSPPSYSRLLRPIPELPTPR